MAKTLQQLDKQAGEVIFREGDDADCAYIIEKGRIEISLERDGRPCILGELEAGEILGEMAMIDEFNRTATARVAEDCRLTVVTPKQIQQRVEDADPVVRALLRILLTRYRSELRLQQGDASPMQRSLMSSHGGIEKIRFENELRQALESGDVYVAYQPICRLDTRTVEGFEALVRWDHPNLGTIPSTDLISLAEETDLIDALSRLVLNIALKDMTTFQSTADRALFMSLNISPRQTNGLDFLEAIGDVCTRTSLNPGEELLELTESMLVSIQQLETWTEAARGKGFQITVDDFGTGFASLEYLTRLVPDVVKIDQKFVGPVIENARNRAVLKRLLQMAHDLDVLVIAEGAETTEHTRILSELGCDMAQGFGIGRPVPISGAMELLKGR